MNNGEFIPGRDINRSEQKKSSGFSFAKSRKRRLVKKLRKSGSGTTKSSSGPKIKKTRKVDLDDPFGLNRFVGLNCDGDSVDTPINSIPTVVGVGYTYQGEQGPVTEINCPNDEDDLDHNGGGCSEQTTGGMRSRVESQLDLNDQPTEDVEEGRLDDEIGSGENLFVMNEDRL